MHACACITCVCECMYAYVCVYEYACAYMYVCACVCGFCWDLRGILEILSFVRIINLEQFDGLGLRNLPLLGTLLSFAVEDLTPHQVSFIAIIDGVFVC